MKTEYKLDLKSPAEVEGLTDAAQECPTSQEDGNVRRTLAKKVCRTCKLELSTLEFYFNRKKNSYFSECKTCNKIRSGNWNKNNKEKYKFNCRKHKLENPDLYKAYKRKEYKKNIDSYRKNAKQYRRSEHGKAVRHALNRERELRKVNATPPWLSKEQREEMKKIYKNCPKGYHVDHIHPLNHKDLCGLHVPWNLQYLPAADNIRKRNKLLS